MLDIIAARYVVVCIAIPTRRGLLRGEAFNNGVQAPMHVEPPPLTARSVQHHARPLGTTGKRSREFDADALLESQFEFPSKSRRSLRSVVFRLFSAYSPHCQRACCQHALIIRIGLTSKSHSFRKF